MHTSTSNRAERITKRNAARILANKCDRCKNCGGGHKGKGRKDKNRK